MKECKLHTMRELLDRVCVPPISRNLVSGNTFFGCLRCAALVRVHLCGLGVKFHAMPSILQLLLSIGKPTGMLLVVLDNNIIITKETARDYIIRHLRINVAIYSSLLASSLIQSLEGADKSHEEALVPSFFNEEDEEE